MKICNNTKLFLTDSHRDDFGTLWSKISCGRLDGWPSMETDAGRAVMTTPATNVTVLFQMVMPTPVATTRSISRSADNHLATKYSKGFACSERSYPYCTDTHHLSVTQSPQRTGAGKKFLTDVLVVWLYGVFLLVRMKPFLIYFLGLFLFSH